MKTILSALSLMLLTLLSCKKQDDHEGSIFGYVYTAHSSTPVYRALIRSLNYKPTAELGMGTYTIVTMDTTGPDGYFEIPFNDEVTDVLAWGINSIYPDPSNIEKVAHFQKNRMPIKSYLEAPGWLRFVAADQQLNQRPIYTLTIEYKSRKSPQSGPAGPGVLRGTIPHAGNQRSDLQRAPQYQVPVRLLSSGRNEMARIAPSHEGTRNGRDYGRTAILIQRSPSARSPLPPHSAIGAAHRLHSLG
ncbi:MAG: hypothetical protein ACK5XV_02515 [Flavobacteriales bacterium]|jgi:hypothetical protein